MLIGKDTRISGYMIESALEAGFASAGVDVLLTGPLPTPGVAYLTRALRLSLGRRDQRVAQPVSATTASSSSRRAARSCPTHGSSRSKRRSSEQPQWVDSAELGKARRLDDARGRYIEFCKSTFSQRAVAEGAEDRRRCGARRRLPRRARRLPRARRRSRRDRLQPERHQHQRRLRRHGAGRAGRTRCKPTAPTTASRSTATPTGCSWSMRTGRLYNGDELLYVMVADRLAQGAAGAGRRRHADDQHGGRAGAARARRRVRARQGRRPLRARGAVARGWQLGGEGSGHLLALDKHTTGDGIVSALLVLQAVCRSGRSLAELLKDVTLFPQTLINVRLQPGTDWTAQRRARRRAGRGRARARRRRPRADPAVGHRAAGARDGRGARRGAGQALRRAPGRDPGLSGSPLAPAYLAGGSRTLSTTWITPLVARTSGVVTTASSTVTKVPALYSVTFAALNRLDRAVLDVGRRQRARNDVVGEHRSSGDPCPSRAPRGSRPERP